MKTAPILFLIFLSVSCPAQDTINSRSDIKKENRRLGWVIASESTAFVGGFGLLYYVWYKDYPATDFHLFNDNPEWLQVDKAGHAWTGYHLARTSASVLEWAGMERRKAQWIGVGESALFLTTMEVFDGFANDWGFSFGDIAANLTGQGLFIGQEYLWDEQRISLKFFSHFTPYAQYRPDLLGNDGLQRLIKDYNGHTYWLNVNLHSFIQKDWMPTWIDLSLGYGAEGMVSGRPEDNELYGSNDLFLRYRQYYLSLDLNVDKLKVRKKWLKVLLSPFRMIKFPFPALQFDKNGIKGYFYSS